MIDRLDAYQRRHPWVGFPLAVVYKYVDDQGGYLAALIAYYGFLSLFPVLLLAVTTLGFLLEGNPELQARILDSAVSEIPVVGDQIRENVRGLHGSVRGLVSGLLFALYGALGMSTAAQSAFNRIWGVPRYRRPDPIRARVRGVLLLLVLGCAVLATTVVSSLPWGGPPVALASVVVNTGILLAAFRLLTVRSVAVRDAWVGAVVAAVAWQGLQTVGAYYVRHELAGASQVYGVFGVVLGLVAWIYLGAVIVLFAAEVNVVRADRLWPRALLTVFTDDVELTGADRRSYRAYARTEQHKGFEEIDVRFHDGPGDRAP
ncbi:MAG TPA: YihY/virulence factor BrkB family protein [Mycobacteriales bacterium]|jgi:YihY family inner membrane protein|nr:YihY/virulence factor BrkB family protein [Mycobacteriales bacterium]